MVKCYNKGVGFELTGTNNEERNCRLHQVDKETNEQKEKSRISDVAGRSRERAGVDLQRPSLVQSPSDRVGTKSANEVVWWDLTDHKERIVDPPQAFIFALVIVFILLEWKSKEVVKRGGLVTKIDEEEGLLDVPTASVRFRLTRKGNGGLRPSNV
ncbi:unnamed protein product [Lactuca saligna]|uniref:Uncharacterized protein n=1 Tax=Lactuca saligna TaxID=75948 RepID=A0AA35ZMD6_LACSI|nr:unnamed protein product [Lactuca saligna]